MIPITAPDTANTDLAYWQEVLESLDLGMGRGNRKIDYEDEDTKTETKEKEKF